MGSNASVNNGGFEYYFGAIVVRLIDGVGYWSSTRVFD